MLSDPIHMWPVRGYRHVVVPAAAVEAFDGDDRDEGDSDAGEPRPPDPDEGGGDGGVGADELEEGGGDDDDDDDGGAADGPTGPRSKALVSAAVPGGRIAYYRGGTFQAVCHLSTGTHQTWSVNGSPCKCQLSRTSRGSDDNENQGRPLSLLAAWLSVASSYPDKPSHTDVFVPLALSYERRQTIRDRLMAVVPSFKQLAEHERKPREGEASEPRGWC